MELTLQIITIVLAVIGLIAAPLAVYLRKKGKSDAADLVDALGGGVDTAKTLLTGDQAKAITRAIKAKAEAKGVLGILDAALAAAGHNAKSRADLIHESDTEAPTG
jgi:hypothetical protein